jgi:hypothetical protein
MPIRWRIILLYAEQRKMLLRLKQNGIPICLIHHHDELVTGDAGIVDQDIDLPLSLDGVLDHLLDLVGLGDVGLKRQAVPPPVLMASTVAGANASVRWDSG